MHRFLHSWQKNPRDSGLGELRVELLKRLCTSDAARMSLCSIAGSITILTTLRPAQSASDKSAGGGCGGMCGLCPVPIITGACCLLLSRIALLLFGMSSLLPASFCWLLPAVML
jgi:hypothetical protein